QGRRRRRLGPRRELPRRGRRAHARPERRERCARRRPACFAPGDAVPRRVEGGAGPARRSGARRRAAAPARLARRRGRRGRAYRARMARIVIAGAGAVGASIAYHLALLGADDVVLAERDTVASGATGKAMGGFRQQFSSEAEVRLAQESAKLFRELGPPLFEAVGYMFLATSDDGWARLRERAAMQRGLGVPVEEVDATGVRGLRTDDVAGAVACWEDGGAEPAAVTEELVRRAAELVDEALVGDWRTRLAQRYPPAAGAPVVRAWAGLYDMTPDAHPIIGWVGDGVYAACGFSGHGFMQSPAVGRAVAEELLHGESELDLSPYRLERFAGEAVFPETLVL